MLALFQRIFETWQDFPLREGQMIHHRYRICSFLGQGSFGLAYRAEDLHQERKQVIVKHNRPSKKMRAIQLLQNEFVATSELRHPAIAASYDFFNWKHKNYFVSEWIQGDTLESIIFDQSRVVTEQKAIAYSIEILQILQYVHQSGWVHLDVRLPNIIQNEKGLHLIDFGLARRIGDHVEEEPLQEGKLAYRHLAEPQSDLYAVGHLMLFLLYSNFQTQAHETDEEISWEVELQCSHAMKQLIRKLLKIDVPFDRAEQVIEALIQIKNQPK